MRNPGSIRDPEPVRNPESVRDPGSGSTSRQDAPLDAGEQWAQVKDRGADAICLFSGLAVLQKPMPSAVIAEVTALDSRILAELLADPCFEALLVRDEEDRRAIGSSFLEAIVIQELPDQGLELHRRAVEVFERRLTASESPDALAALRLPHHVRVVGGDEAFCSSAFVCFPHLYALGLLDESLELLHLVADVAEANSDAQAKAYGNLGIIYRVRGDLDRAEQMYEKALDIGTSLGNQERVAIQYGNLGVVHEARGDLDQAEAMYSQAVQLYEGLGHVAGMANGCGNLAIVLELQGDWQASEAMYRRSLAFFSDLEDGEEGAISMLGNLADLLENLGRAEEADGLRERAWSLQES